MAIIKCPECGHQVSDKAPTCPNCGIEIAGKTTQCPQCGEIYFDEQPQCPKCGHETHAAVVNAKPIQQPIAQSAPMLNQNNTPPAQPTTTPAQETPTPAQTTTPSSNRRTILIVLLVIVLLCGAVYAYYSTHSQSREEQSQYEYAMLSNDPNVMQSYLDAYVDAPQAHRDTIQARLAALTLMQKEWTDALISNSKISIAQYLETHPNSPYKAEALHKIDSIDWAVAQQAATKDAYTRYLEDHPNGEHVDEAQDGIKGVNAKTVSPQEKQIVISTFKQFFQSINNRDEESLSSTVDNVLTTFLGKANASRADVLTFMHKLYKDDITAINWRLTGDYKIDKKEVGDEEYEYTVNFTVLEDVTRGDAGITTLKYRVKAKVGPSDKITEFNMVKILE